MRLAHSQPPVLKQPVLDAKGLPECSLLDRDEELILELIALQVLAVLVQVLGARHGALTYCHYPGSHQVDFFDLVADVVQASPLRATTLRHREPSVPTACGDVVVRHVVYPFGVDRMKQRARARHLPAVEERCVWSCQGSSPSPGWAVGEQLLPLVV